MLHSYSEGNSDIQFHTVPVTPLSYSLKSRPSLQTESNAFSISMNVASVTVCSLNPDTRQISTE